MRQLVAVIAAFGTLFLLNRVVARWPSIWRNIRYPGSESWTQGRATVESQVLEPYSSKNGTQYRPCLSYSYSVQGEYFGGTYKGNMYPSEDAAQSLLDQYPVNSALTIRISPKNPARSVLFLPE